MTRLFDYWEKGEPLELWTRRLRLDALFALVFFVVMCDRFTENPIHETLGTVIGLVALLHALLNRRWYKRRWEKLTGRATRRTPCQVRDVVSLVVNVFLTLSFAAAFVSGLMCSQTLFAAVTPDAWRMDLAYRSAHVALSLWCFLAAAVHAGLHAGIVAGKLARGRKSSKNASVFGACASRALSSSRSFSGARPSRTSRGTSRTRLWPRPPICTWNAGSLRSSSRLTF